MNWYNSVISYLYFKNSIIDIHSFKGFVKKSEREIRVWYFGERNNDGMAEDKIYHDSHRFIIIHGSRENNWVVSLRMISVEEDEVHAFDDFFWFPFLKI